MEYAQNTASKPVPAPAMRNAARDTYATKRCSVAHNHRFYVQILTLLALEVAQVDGVMTQDLGAVYVEYTTTTHA